MKKICIALSIILLSCAGSRNKDGQSPASDNTQTGIGPGGGTRPGSEMPAEDPSGVSYNFPSALQITSLFKKSGLEYIEGITRTPKNVQESASNFIKALSLGMYGADLAYCILNKQSQEAMNFVKASTQLAEALGMGRIYAEGNFVKRFETNIGDEDSLKDLISELQMETDTYLQRNEQQQIAAISFSGVWTEVMYLGSKSFDQNKGTGLIDNIDEQMGMLKKIIAALKSNEKKDPGIRNLLTQLDALSEVYNGFDSVKKSKSDLKEEEAGLIISLNEQETSVLIKKISELRNQLISSAVL